MCPFSLLSYSPAPTKLILVLVHSLGGMAGAIVTAPFDVVKTRLQSDLFARVADTSSRTGLRALLWNFVDTGKILRSVLSPSSSSLAGATSSRD